MSIAFIGIISIVSGIWGLFLGKHVLLKMLAVAMVLGSAAAFFVGSANILPGQVLLGFLAIGVLADSATINAFLREFRFGRPAFWLLLLVAYGLLSAYFAPRLFAGETAIIPLGRSSYASTGSTVPLGPVSSNLTQSLYMISNLACFGLCAAIASRADGLQLVLKALIAYCVANLFFAFLDLATFATGTEALLSFIRNAQYTLHVDDEVAGMKRIVGSFTEASSFARATLGVLGFSGTLWLAGYKPVLTGVLTISAAALAVLSTSSTGLAGAPIVLLLLYFTGLQLAITRGLHGHSLFFLIIAPLGVVAIMLLMMINVTIWDQIYEYVELLLLNKTSSDSGIERGNWNAVAMQNFSDTNGLGVGLGTVRTSSLLVALLACVGIPGTLFYLAFCVSAFLSRSRQLTSLEKVARIAGRNGCLGLLVGDLVVSSSIDQGLFFYMLAALAATSIVARTERTHFSPRMATP